MSDQNPPEGAVRYEWTGRNLGSITLQNVETGNTYQAGFNMDHRFLWVAKEDVSWADSQAGLVAAPLEEAAPEKPAAKPKPNAAKPEAVAAPVVNAPVDAKAAAAPTDDKATK